MGSWHAWFRSFGFHGSRLYLLKWQVSPWVPHLRKAMHAPRQTLVQQLQRKLAKQEEQASWWSPNQTRFQHGFLLFLCVTAAKFPYSLETCPSTVAGRTLCRPLCFCISCSRAAWLCWLSRPCSGCCGAGSEPKYLVGWTSIITGLDDRKAPYLWVKTMLRFYQPNQSIDTSYPRVSKHGNWKSMNILCNWGFHGKFLYELWFEFVHCHVWLPAGNCNSPFLSPGSHMALGGSS